MSTINVITIIAIILFARLGVRLYQKYREINNEEKERQDEEE